MCLAVPGRVTEILSADAEWARVARVDFGGVVKEVSLAYVPELTVGDWTVVHAGFALARLDEDAARASLETWRELAAPDDAPGTSP